MSNVRKVEIFLEPDLRESAESGRHNFIQKMRDVLEEAQFRVCFCDIDTLSTTKFSLTHMKGPKSENGLVFRRVYHYPFWQIEAVKERWDWDVAKASFDPARIEPKEAARFARFWRNRLFGDFETGQGGYVYIPLQGRLLDHRSFQQCSPVEMIEATLSHCGARRVIVGLHPKEHYSQPEIDALERLEKTHRQLSIEVGNSEALLAHCDYVVTQNSAVAFSGYFLGKSALLMAKIDFHHIAVRANMGDLRGSFERVEQHCPVFEKYLWWFWQDQSINAGRSEVKQKIRNRFARFGWLEKEKRPG